jgi:hypothetical protein
MDQPQSWVLLLVSLMEVFTKGYNSSEFQELLTPAIPLFYFQTVLMMHIHWPLVPYMIQQQVSFQFYLPLDFFTN